MATEKLYTNRCAAIIPVSISLEKEAWAFAREQAISRNAVGRYLSRLVYEERARQEERDRLKATLHAAIAVID